MPLNLLPDYVAVKDGKIISGGHFDNQWRTNSGLKRHVNPGCGSPC